MTIFDRVLFRVVGLLFLILIALALIPLLRSLGQPSFRGLEPPPVSVRQGAKSSDKETLQLGRPSRVDGTPLIQFALVGENRSSASSFSKGSTHREQTRNVLYVDSSTVSSWWLFDTSENAILKQHEIWADLAARDKRVIATVYEVATKDTNGDHFISEFDRPSVYFSSADGRKISEIVPAADKICSVDQMSNDQILIVYQHGDVTTAATFSTQDGAKIKESPVADRK